jgi:UDP-2-acetamido-2,6-beta-L-arabino-hexul-4-ose reductase
MINIGITGISGLLGWHLRAYLYSLKDINIRGATRATFENDAELIKFVSSCEVIVHFAGANRGEDKEILQTNTGLTDKLINAFKKNANKPHIIFASSTQIYKNTVYGNSKIECSKKLQIWAKNNNALFSNLILPNIFGECGKPFYNSVVSTFCYQIANNQIPEIKIDAEIEFLHAGEVARQVYEIITDKRTGKINFSGVTLKVSSLLKMIQNFAILYKDHLIPDLKEKFDLQLFNTYRSYLYPQHYPVSLQLNKDERGEVFETARSLSQGQSFISTTKAGVTRGNHYHLEKFERFLVLKGKAVIKIRRLFSNDINIFEVNGETPSFIDIPTLHTHSITNIDSKELVTFFWSNEIFNPDLPDTFLENVEVKNEKT